MFKQLITPAVTKLIVAGGADLLNSQRGDCKKVCYRTPARAQKALKEHGYALGCTSWHKCHKHGTTETYHLTSHPVPKEEK